MERTVPRKRCHLRSMYHLKPRSTHFEPLTVIQIREEAVSPARCSPWRTRWRRCRRRSPGARRRSRRTKFSLTSGASPAVFQYPCCGVGMDLALCVLVHFRWNRPLCSCCLVYLFEVARFNSAGSKIPKIDCGVDNPRNCISLFFIAFVFYLHGIVCNLLSCFPLQAQFNLDSGGLSGESARPGIRSPAR